MSVEKPKLRLLCVDDEEPVLSSLRRLCRRHYDVTLATSGKQGLELAEHTDFDIVISDMRMPQMDGAEFLSRLAKTQANSVRILLTGYADHAATVRAINDGRIFRYLNKPWDNEQLLATLGEAAQQRERLVAISKLNLDADSQEVGKKLAVSAGSATAAVPAASSDEQIEAWVMLLADIVNPHIGLNKSNLKIAMHWADHLGDGIGLTATLRRDLRWALLLHGIGLLELDEPKRPKEQLSREDADRFRAFPVQSEAALWNKPEIKGASRIIRYIRESWDGSGFPDHLEAENIPLCSRILRPLVELMDWLDRAEHPLDECMARLSGGRGISFDPDVVDKLLPLLKENPFGDQAHDDLSLSSTQLVPGMVTSRPVLNSQKQMILNEGIEITTNIMSRLLTYETGRQEYLTIFVQKPESEDESELAADHSLESQAATL